MDFNIRPIARAEHMYCYSWSSHIMAAAGCIGHLRGDMGSEGNGFYTTWFDHKEDLKAQDFKDELDTVVNALRFDAAYGGVLASRGKLAAYCRAHPDSAMGTISREYGFRADTDKYTYMLRLTPNWGEYNFYIYCYVREQLDNYMTSAERGIRFVDSHYRDLFRLADGDSIRIIKPDGEYADRTCRYVGETHMTCGWDDRLYHIHNFAEQMEQAGNTVVPLRSSLPEKCFAALETTGETIIIHRGVKGCTPTGQRPEGVSGQEGADKLNEQIGVTRAQAAAMLAGSMRREDGPRLYDMMGRFDRELQEAIAEDETGDGFIFEMFLYELGNHEYDVTMDLDETLAALDYTMDAIQADPRLSHGLERARLEILGATS